MNDWKTVNGERFDAESIARWFFQVDDRRQEECKKLILSAQKLAYQRGAREMAEKAAQHYLTEFSNWMCHCGWQGKSSEGWQKHIRSLAGAEQSAS
jgi:hypothetical protein